MKRITLQAWAERSLDIEPAPSIRTLRRWACEGLIYPQPTKVGRCYFVEPDAIRVDPADTGAIVRYHQKKQQHAA